MKSVLLYQVLCRKSASFSATSAFVRCFAMASAPVAEKILPPNGINPNIIRLEYAVRGPLVIRATELEKELEKGVKKPFSRVIKANIGDAHAMGQPYMTFIRQVEACVSYPKLLESSDFPSDVKERAKRLLSACGGGSVGSYSQSNGIEAIRNDVAEFITKRDGDIHSHPDNIILSGGASEAIRSLLNMFVIPWSDGKLTGVMVPIPQYPLYSATIEEYHMHKINYFLDEDNKWGLDVAELKRSINEAKKVCHPKVLVVINPGNPTGQVQSRKNIEDVIKFAYEEKLFIFADEVYQDNVYDPTCQFHSFKKVLFEMGAPYNSMELASFYSASKGFAGECGQRGGFGELVNMDPEVMAQYKKSISARLCSTVVGQIVMDCIVNPPKFGDPSHDLFFQEKKQRLDSLAHRAELICKGFNAIEGIKCNPVQGAMYAFPKISLPEKAIAKAKSLKQEPDFFYAMQLLESTGVCVVPGSGFGQIPGTYHFRTTILPQVPLLEEMLKKFKEFHEKFVASYK